MRTFWEFLTEFDEAHRYCDPWWYKWASGLLVILAAIAIMLADGITP